MATTAAAVIDRREAKDGKPSITYRYAGDRGVLIEYGEMEFDLTLNFFMLAVDAALRANPPTGMVETAPGFRSILVMYEPSELSLVDLVDHLRSVHGALGGEQGMTIPSRIVHMPIAFDDSTSSDDQGDGVGSTTCRRSPWSCPSSTAKPPYARHSKASSPSR